MKTARKRSTYLLVSQINTLDTWAKELNNMLPKGFKEYGAYLVGSATRHKDYRDVDIRQVVADADLKRLKSCVDLGYFNHMVSVWGQQVTGLPIDYQIIGLKSKENESFSTKDGHYRHPVGMRHGYVNGEKRI